MEDSPSCGISQIQTATSFVNGVVVSIHDVHPGSQVIVEEILRDLVLVGVTETSLLVVPNWHGKYPISAHPEFLTWVRSKIKSHEVVMHGCFHRRDELKGQRSIIDNVVTKFYTAGEGEFYDTSIEKTKKLIRTGLGYFESS
ncbi:MAG: DUF2334 domain-containing protein, partial [Chthoniobacterales bacterium]|nr:DUF2334 domain-containing protein [Chthoniobacterales bacterium]